MSAEARARVLAAAEAEPSPTRADVRRRNAWLAVLAVASGLCAFAVFAALESNGRWIGLGGDVSPSLHAERPIGLVAATAGGAFAIAAVVVWLALARGRSMLGRSPESLTAAAVLAPIALFIWKIFCSATFGYRMIEWPDRAGFRCFTLTLVVAIGPLASFLAIRRSAPLRPALNGAILGVAAGACSWFAVDLWCPVAYVPHLVFGHLLPVFVLAAFGALVGSGYLSRRGPRR
jgi:hypothetical protein